MSDEKTQLAEAIAHAEDVIKADDCSEDCALEHAQLAMWLRELLSIKFPEPLPLPDAGTNVVSLDQHRIRANGEFADESVAYVEALWGKSTFAFNAAVRDLEAMRRGTEEPGMPLRPPETYHEATHLIRHVRALANDLARHFKVDDEIREVDDEAVGRKP